MADETREPMPDAASYLTTALMDWRDSGGSVEVVVGLLARLARAAARLEIAEREIRQLPELTQRRYHRNHRHDPIPKLEADDALDIEARTVAGELTRFRAIAALMAADFNQQHRFKIASQLQPIVEQIDDLIGLMYQEGVEDDQWPPQ